jgi:HD-like signal output (HDOD) protein
VGKIVMASAFPDHFYEIYHHRAGTGDLLQIEREVMGLDHAELGALYLRRQRLPEIFVDLVQYHHHPQLVRHHSTITAAVQVADMLVRHMRIGDSGNTAEVALDSWRESAGWKILFAHQNDAEKAITYASLQRSLDRIPAILESLV